MEWQPIETAPKDGQPFLAVMGSKIPFVTSWCDNDGWFTFNQCYETTIQKLTGRRWAPTHWMPLPKPPAGS